MTLVKKKRKIFLMKEWLKGNNKKWKWSFGEWKWIIGNGQQSIAGSDQELFSVAFPVELETDSSLLCSHKTFFTAPLPFTVLFIIVTLITSATSLTNLTNLFLYHTSKLKYRQYGWSNLLKAILVCWATERSSEHLDSWCSVEMTWGEYNGRKRVVG